MATGFPTAAKDLTIEMLRTLVHTMHPDVTVEGFDVIDSWTFEQGAGKVSTAGRIAVEVEYGPGGQDLPSRLILKVNRQELGAQPLYRNEVDIYRKLRPEFGPEIETPRCVGAAFDEETSTFAVAMEDLTVRGARFPNVTVPVSIAELESLLDTLAVLHAAYWETPRFAEDLAWVQPHVEGELHEMFWNMVPAGIAYLVDTVQFKRELVAMVGQTASSLEAQMKKVQRHQATLARTVCHGDGHIGNAYFVDQRGGLLDWQLTARGHHMHDVHYLLITALSVEDRRTHERQLLEYYLDRLGSAGVAAVPDFATTWMEYRRAAVWGFYVGWLTTPVENYGWEICVNNHIRLATAYMDLETADAIAEID